jgi:multidrug efflux pump subunit AcrA (membrane-fusion protein)
LRRHRWARGASGTVFSLDEPIHLWSNDECVDRSLKPIKEQLMNARFVVTFSCLFLLLPGVAVRATAQAPAVELRAHISGYLQKVHCKQGVAVKKDDLLFEIDAAPYLAQLDQAAAQVALVEAQLMLQRKNFERAKKLVDQKAISKEDYDEAEGKVSVAQAQLAVAKASFAAAALPVSAAKIHAPIDGTITRLPVIAGNLIKADDTVLGTLQPDPIKKADGPAKKADGPDKIKELLKERRDVLQKVADQLMVQYRAGQITGRVAMLAQKAALEAGLELAETPAERIDGLRNLLKLAEQIHAHTEAQVEVGKAAQVDALQTRAIVLEARITLLRAEQNAKAK